MKKKEFFIALFVFLAVIVVFFYKTFFMGHIPFPGDLLVSEYKPWSTYSYLGYVPGSVPNKAQYFDVLRQLYPWRIFAMSELKQGNIPLWNPYNFSGSPLLANFQSAVFYPLNILFFLLPDILAWGTLVILQPFLALLFTYLFARKIGLSTIGSIFTAITFAFSSFMTVWLEYNTIGHVILWMPLVLLCIENLIEKVSVKWSLFFVFSLLASFLAGHPQVFGYLCLFLFAYIAYRIFDLKIEKKVRLFSFVASLFLIVLGVGGIQLIPGIELIQHAARSTHSYEDIMQKILIQPWQLIMFVVPDFFGNPATRNYIISDTYVGKVTSIGVVGFLFFLIGLFHKRNTFVSFFSLTGFAVLILATANPITALLYKMQIPIFSSSSPTLAIFLFCFSASIIAGFGITALKTKSNSAIQKSLLTAVVLFILLWTVIIVSQEMYPAIWSTFLLRSVRPTILATFFAVVSGFLLLVLLKKPTLRKGVVVLVLILQCFDLFYSFHKFNPFSPYEFIFPKVPLFSYLQKNAGINRFWGYGSGSVEANFATAYRLFSPDGYDPLYPKEYGQFIQSSKDGRIADEFTGKTRSDAVIAPGFGALDLPANKDRLQVLDMLGVKYVLDRVENKSTEKTFPQDRFRLVHEENGWKVFENKKMNPRVFLTASKGKVQVLTYLPNKAIFSSQSNSDAKLFLSDTYYPGWKAYVDDKPVEIKRAYHAFREITVPSGNHTVSFQFEPDSFRIGLTTSLASIGALLIFMITIYKRKVLQ